MILYSLSLNHKKGIRLKLDDVIKYGGFHPEYSEERKYFEEGKLYSIQIESNLACPQGCLYCYASSENIPMKELPKQDIISIINSAANMKVKAIDWLGGDPLLRKDWYTLMKFVIKKGMRNNIWTSGIPLKNKAVAQKAVEVSEGGFISVHLDTLDEKLYHKLHTGNSKTKIAAILKGIDNVQELGKKPEHMINCITFSKILAKDVENTIKYFFVKKGMRTCLTQMCMSGLAENHPEWIPTIDEIQYACNIRDKLNYPNSTVSMSSMDVNKFYCGAMICVTIGGDVTPCSVIRKGVGNIHNASLEQIIEDHRNELLHLRLRDQKNMPGQCSTCENNTICWGCRATAFYSCGDACGVDPNCYKNL